MLVKGLEPGTEAAPIEEAFAAYGEVSNVHFPNHGVVDGKVRWRVGRGRGRAWGAKKATAFWVTPVPVRLPT